MTSSHTTMAKHGGRWNRRKDYDGVWTPEEYDGDDEFPKTHEGLEQAIELANIFKSFVVAENADCTSETVWTHPELKAASDKERCAYYERGTFHGD